MAIIQLKRKTYEVIETYHNHKMHVKRKGKDFIIIPFASIEDFKAYLAKKKILRRNKVKMPKLCQKDKKGLYILEQYIPGESAVKIIAENRLDATYYKELFRVYRQNRFAGISISYRPEYFIYLKKWFYYLGDYVGDYKKDITFESSEDILLWMNTENAERYCKAHGYTYVTRETLKPGANLNKQLALLCVQYW